MEKKKSNLINAALIIAVSTYLVSLLWEVAHSMLYNWNQLPLKNEIYFYIPMIMVSTLGDVFVILTIFLINSIFRKGFTWISFPTKRDYIALTFLGVIFAIGIEIRAMFFNLWSYNQYMPLVFGIGLTPLIQLSITGIIVLFLTSRFVKVIGKINGKN